jgi:hypothetical protein
MTPEEEKAAREIVQRCSHTRHGRTFTPDTAILHPRGACEEGRREGMREAESLLRPEYPDAVAALKRRAASEGE